MGKPSLEGRYQWLLLQSRGKGQRRCAKGLGLEGQDQDMGNDVHLIMDVLDLVLYPVHALPAIHQVQEADTAQGPTLLPQSGVMTTLFPQVEGMQTNQDRLEVLHESETAITVAGHILLVMTMLQSKIQIMTGNLHTSLRTCRAIGAGGHLGEHRYHRLDPGDGGARKDAKTSLVVNVGWIINLLVCNILFSGMHGY